MSEAGARAEAFVSAHLAEAVALGERLADLTEDPEAYLAALTEGLAQLVDPDYLRMVTRACPETPARYALRGPLTKAVGAPVSRALREGSSISALRLARRLAEADHRDLRLHALEPLRRALPQDPEMTWQVMRRLGRSAEDWIATDSLADLWARGVLAEDFRWAELEQLLYSQHTYERRLVAATLAALPHRVPGPRRGELRATAVPRTLELLRLLMGDAEVMVQKALSWALREWTLIDPDAVAAFLRAETAIAAEQADGARAWVIRDTLARQTPALAAELRQHLEGLRRDRRRPSTSIASSQAAAFASALASSTDAVAAQGDRYTRSRP
jgi:3-methyladenine DNA glycosylase AlkD